MSQMSDDIDSGILVGKDKGIPSCLLQAMSPGRHLSQEVLH